MMEKINMNTELVEDWSVDCSDDEKYEMSKWNKIAGMTVPSAEDVASLYEVLCSDRVISLKWRSYGRRSPTPTDQGQLPLSEVATKPGEKHDDSFDFDIDDMASSEPKLPVRRREGELKGGARKKTTSFDGVISNMKRFWKLDNEPQSSTNN